MQGKGLVPVLAVVVLTTTPLASGTQKEEADEPAGEDKPESDPHELRMGPEEQSERQSPAGQDSVRRIDEHLRLEQLLERPVEVPEQTGKEKQ